LSRFRLIFIAILVGFISIAGFSIGWSYYHALAQAEAGTLMRLGGIVNSLALQIDGNAHEALMRRYASKDDIQTNGQDSQYAAIHHILQRNYVANMLHSPVYTIVYDTAAHHYAFGVTSAEMPYFRHPYRSAPTALMEKGHEGAMIPRYRDEFGVWLSAFAVVKNKQGRVVALVQADEHFEAFILNTRKEALQNIGVISLIFLGLLLVLLRIIQPMLAREQRDKKALKAVHDQTVALDHFRKEMLANVSHDLRTPMASILGYAETLQQKSAVLTADERDKYLNIIASEARRMNKMIGELFDLSRLESGQVELHKEPVNLSELAQDNLHKYTEQARERNINLVTDFQTPLPLLNADIQWIDRVIQNLLENAFKYVNDGGVVKITIFVRDSLLHFKVCNSGKPIKTEHLPHIFERYFRSSNRSKDSTGLGLSIVKKTIELHNGRVWAEVKDDITTFRFELGV
jgi:signal transduction histidine kinase